MRVNLNTTIKELEAQKRDWDQLDQKYQDKNVESFNLSEELRTAKVFIK